MPEASSNCSRCGYKFESAAMKSFHLSSQDADKIGIKDADMGKVEYYNISPKQLVILSLVTFGLYDIYWFYKNWQAVAKFENKKISPFWRAIFSPIWCFGMFKRMLISAKKNGYQGDYNPAALAVLYIVLMLVMNFMDEAVDKNPGLIPAGSFMLYNLVSFIIGQLTIISIFVAQKAASFSNAKLNAGQIKNKNYSGGEIVLIVVGVIICLLIILGIFAPGN